MRPLEILLLAADALALLAVVVPLRGRARRIRHAALIAPLAMGAQLLVEGPRWQMVPAYVLTGLFFLVWLLRTIAPAARLARRGGTHRVGAGLGIGLGVLGLAVAITLPLIVPVFRFPQPSGPYRIGTLTYHWVDTDRPEIFTADPNDHRELMVQIWYPAKGDPSSPRAAYVPHAGALAPLARLAQLPEFSFDHFRYVTTNAIPDAPVAVDRPSYPVVIFSSGRGGYRQSSTLQIEDLVSHGYIVAAIDHPYVSSGVVFPDGRQVSLDPRMLDLTFVHRMIPYLAHDSIFTLDQLAAVNQADPKGVLTGRLDLQRAGIFGVSLGGGVSLEACRLEPRLRACLDMDNFVPADVVAAGLEQPTMYLTRDIQTMQREGWSQTDIDEAQTTMRALFERLPADGYFVRVPGMFHDNFSDAPWHSPLPSWIGITGPIDPQRAHSIVNAYSLAFFDRHLKGRPAPLLDGPSRHYPEVLFETRRSSQAPDTR